MIHSWQDLPVHSIQFYLGELTEHMFLLGQDTMKVLN